jgi:uncharacterized protein YecT (DUF1311 family)
MIAELLLALAAGPCDANLPQSDLTVCWVNRAKHADADLNAAYRRTLDGLNKLGVDPKPFVHAQVLWIAARDKTCAFESSLYAGGSIAPAIDSECVDRMTRARTQRIGAFLNARNAGAIAPSKPVSASVDNELNRVYGLFFKQELTAAQKNALTAAEVAWLAYRDAACSVEGGACLDELERERTQELEAGWVGEQFW